MKITTLKKITAAAAVVGLAFGFAACGTDNTTTTSAPPPTDNTQAGPEKLDMGAWDKDGDGIIKVGFSQNGSESGWRVANTQSYKDYFVAANGFELLLAEADNDSTKQMAQFRDFITQGAEVIVVQPEANEGWEPALQEAKTAGIPIINSDRKLGEGMEQYYEFFFGSNMRGEGDAAVAWLESYIAANNMKNEDIKILHLQGSMGSDAQMGRTAGLDAGVEKNGWKIVKRDTGSFSKDGGMQAMTAFLASVKADDFTVVWGENDDMIYGALDAMAAKGLDPKNYIIVSFDGNKTAVQMVKDGIIDAIAQCNPLLGDQVGPLILKASKGEKIPSPQYSVEGVIDPTNVDEWLPKAFGV